MEDDYREPTRFEREILARLTDLSGSGDDIREQIASCRVRTIAEYGDHRGTFEIEMPGSYSKRGLKVLADAVAHDIDGAPIEAILFASNERICEVEILRLDGSPILRMPQPTEFDLFV